MGGFFFCSVHVKQAPMPGRHLPNKNRHQRWCWRLVWEWKCDGARTPNMLTLWYRATRTKHTYTARASQIFAVSLLSGWHDLWSWQLHTFFSRFQIQSNEKFGSATRHFLPHAHSNFTKSEVLGNTKIGTYPHQLWQSGFHAVRIRTSRSFWSAWNTKNGTQPHQIWQSGLWSRNHTTPGRVWSGYHNPFSSRSDWPLPWQQSRDMSESTVSSVLGRLVRASSCEASGSGTGVIC